MLDVSEERRRRYLPRDLVRASFATEQAVYGVLLVSGMIVVTGRYGSTSWQVLLTVVVTVLVFWSAHVYAGTVARHGSSDDHPVPLRESLRLAVQDSWGLLLSALVPCAILLLGTLRVVPDAAAMWAALWAGIVILGVLGYLAFRRRGSAWWVRVLGAITTAAFGLVLAGLKAFIH